MRCGLKPALHPAILSLQQICLTNHLQNTRVVINWITGHKS